MSDDTKWGPSPLLPLVPVQDLLRELDEEVASICGLPVECLGQIHAADIPRAGERAREAALTAPFRLAAHEERR